MKNIIFFLVVLSVVHRESFGFMEQKLAETIKHVISKNNISSKCTNSLNLYINILNNTDDEKIWALQMLDATSKIPVGLLSYNFVEAGNFIECTEIESKRDKIKGKYCLGKVTFNSTIASEHFEEIGNELYLHHLLSDINHEQYCTPQHPFWAMCLPSDCSDEDAILIMSMIQTSGASIGSVTCQTIEDVYPELDTGAIIGISILSILILIIAASTAYDIYCQNKNEIGSPSYIAFSLYTNGKNLFRLTRRTSPLSCLDGIRVISSIWVIYFHTYEAYTGGLVFNTNDAINFNNYLVSMLAFSSTLPCDTFFVIGGTLVTYLFFKKEKKANLALPTVMKHYFHRYARLTPPLAGLVLVAATLTKYMGSGPRWPDILRSHQDTCVKHWWTSLLYIQNRVGSLEMCTEHTWYLDVDMQLYLLSPFLIWIFQKYTKTGMSLVVLGMLASTVNAFNIAYENKLTALWEGYYGVTPSSVYVTKYYIVTEARAAPWLMGTILGYLLTRKDFTQIRIAKKIVIPLWIVSLAVMLICVFGGHFYLKGPEYYRLENALHIALVRPSFALAICWIIWACATNHGGIIHTFLSLPMFTLMNRITYSMYIIHVNIVFPYIFTSKIALHLTAFNLAYWFWGAFMLVFGMSVIWVLVFESPTIILEALLYQKIAPKTKTK